jgi:hypothetical protein
MSMNCVEPVRASRRLALYSVATGAAIAAAQTVHASIVHVDPPDTSIALGNSLQFDLDSDGFLDIKLKNYNFAGGPYQGATVNYYPGKIVGFSAGPGSYAYVTNMQSGDPINAGTAGPTFFGSMAYGGANPNAQFNNAVDGYLGLSFPSGPNLFFAWMRVDINNANGSFVVKDWAYENVSGVGIPAGVVPEPASLGLLALGAAGLGMYRNRRPQA